MAYICGLREPDRDTAGPKVYTGWGWGGAPPVPLVYLHMKGKALLLAGGW